MDKFASHYVEHLKRAAYRIPSWLTVGTEMAAGGGAGAYANNDPNDPTKSRAIGAVFGSLGALTGHAVNNGMNARAAETARKANVPNFADVKAPLVNRALGYTLPVAGLDVLGSRSATALQEGSQNNSAQKVLAEAQAKALGAGPGAAVAGPVDKLVAALKADPATAVRNTALSGVGLYALYQAARAAKRIGDGHALRVSTSLRKRPGQSTDLNLGFSQMAPGKLPRKGQKFPGDGHEPGGDEGSAED